MSHTWLYVTLTDVSEAVSVCIHHFSMGFGFVAFLFPGLSGAVRVLLPLAWLEHTQSLAMTCIQLLPLGWSCGTALSNHPSAPSACADSAHFPRIQDFTLSSDIDLAALVNIGYKAQLMWLPLPIFFSLYYLIHVNNW